MLFDPKWEVKADPLSLDGLIAWLGRQPASQKYCYFDRGHCLAAKYNADVGRDYRAVAGSGRDGLG